MNVLGDKGTLYLLDSVTGNLISSINKDTETDENGQIIVNYPDNIQSINIKVISPENVGKIEISTTKTIVKNNEQVLKNSDAINMNVLTSYVYNNQEVQIENIESNVELKETDTSFDFNINRTELSAMTTNSNVEFRIVLNSNNESNKLYENPVLRLKIPNKIENIKVNSINLLYEDEMKIESAKLLDNNILEIKLKGIQTKYKDEAIEGAIIIINADLTTNRKTTSSTEQFVLNLNNGKEQKQIQKDMNIVSYVGLVTVNRISDYGIEVVNNEGNKLGTLELAQKQKTVKVENEIINNEENQIDNIKILGTFPTKDAIDGNI